MIRLLDNKRTDAALFLIEQGADTEITDNSGHKAIDYATAHGLKEVVIRLIVDGTSDIKVIHLSIRRFSMVNRK